MNFVECYICGGLAVQESVRRDQSATIFCTEKLCGRYDITESAMQALQGGATLREPAESVISRIYLANRRDERILISDSDLLTEPAS